MRLNDTAHSRVSQQPMAARICELCQASFITAESRLKSGRGRFCSRICCDTFQRLARPVDQRLWARVDRDGGIPPHRAEYGACWLWTGYRIPTGYGRLYRLFPEQVLTHRLAWELATGETLTSDDVIGHICDVRHCVRNDEAGTYPIRGVVLPRRGHLFKGTNIDNQADMVEKGRHRFVLGAYVRHGEANPHSKLTADAARKIRRLSADGWTQEAIAAEFGVNQTTVSRVILRQTWKTCE